jgi:mycothiol synthase
MLSPHDRQVVDAFLADAAESHGAHLGDHLLADLTHGPRDGFVAALALADNTLADNTLEGYAQASRGNEGFVIDVMAPDHSTTRLDLLRAVIAELPDDEAITWWSHTPDADRPVADALGLVAHRSLLQMRRPLPLDSSLPYHDSTSSGPPVAVRPFAVGVDEAAWLEVNNAAFAWHGEQGGWDLATLQQREREPWFDPSGFLLHERGGRLAAFCWTKLHRDHNDHSEALVGEIYVIAVHPDFHGLGLGRALTVAGLRSLHASGATVGMLYVDADNHAAVQLYTALGFATAHTDQAYTRPEGSTR